VLEYLIPVGIAVGIVVRLATQFGRRYRHLDKLLAERGGVRNRGEHKIARRGVVVFVGMVDISQDEPFGTAASANVLVPSGLRFLRRRNWQSRRLPVIVAGLADAPVIARDDEGVTRSDTLASMPVLDELTVPWLALMRARHVLLACDGVRAIAWVDEAADTPELVDALIDAVVALARWDDGLAAALARLPDAQALGDGELLGVRLPDGVVIGVRDARLIAQLDTARGDASATVASGGVTIQGELPIACSAALARAGDGQLFAGKTGARFTWSAIERDPARHRAAIEALRALAAQGPYR
jgi:hypothetical protein